MGAGRSLVLLLSLGGSQHQFNFHWRLVSMDVNVASLLLRVASRAAGRTDWVNSMKICFWSDSTFITKEINFEMQWNQNCFAANHLHDALKPPVAKRLCPNDFFGEIKCLGGSTVLLKIFVCNVIAPDAQYPLAASESPRSEDTSPSMQKMHLWCVLVVIRLWHRLFIYEFFRLKTCTLVVSLNSVGSSTLAMEDKIS